MSIWKQFFNNDSESKESIAVIRRTLCDCVMHRIPYQFLIQSKFGVHKTEYCTKNHINVTIPRFVRRFHLSKDAFIYVLEELKLEQGIRVTYIPPSIRLAVALIVFATGGYQQLAGDDFICPMSKSTVSEVVNEVLFKAENKLCYAWINFPSVFQDIKQHFWNLYKIPGVIGCIDGTHISILRPINNEHMFFNRKGRHSLNAMVICDHNMRIMAINAKFGGRAHDSFVWSESNERNFIKNLHRQENQMWLLGDSGYPLEPWLITPYRVTDDSLKENFNKTHSRARSLV